MPEASPPSEEQTAVADESPLTNEGALYLESQIFNQLTRIHQMSKSYTRLSPPLNNPPMLTISLFAPFSEPMTRSSHSMGWTRTMTKSICASCSGLVTRERRVNPCTRLSRRCFSSWEYRSYLGTKKMRRRIMAPETFRSKAIRRQKTPGSYEDALDGLPSALSLMQGRKAQELAGFALTQEHHCRAYRLALHQRERPQGRRKTCSPEMRGPELVVHHPCEGG